MDPITLTTTTVTFVSFVKELIQVGKSIAASIEKVKENRRQLRELTEDILRTLVEILNLETPGQNSEILLHSSQRNHDIVIDATLRVEQRIVVNTVESQVKLQKLERMMAEVLLTTSFGRAVLERTVEVIALDLGHQTLESKYLSAQTFRLIPALQYSLASGVAVLDPSLWPQSVTGGLPESPTTESVLHSILGAIVELGKPAIDFEFMNTCVVRLGKRLRVIGMLPESVAWELATAEILRSLAATGKGLSTLLPRLARSLARLSVTYQGQYRYEEAVKASEQSVELWRFIAATAEDFCNQPSIVYYLLRHSEALKHVDCPNRCEDILDTVGEAARLGRLHLEYLFARPSEWDWSAHWAAAQCCLAVFQYGHALGDAGRALEACESLIEAYKFCLMLPLNAGAAVASGLEQATYMDALLHQICVVETNGRLTTSWLSGVVELFRDLAARYPYGFSAPYSRLVYAHVYLAAQTDIKHGQPTTTHLRRILEPADNRRLPDLPPPDHAIYLTLHDLVRDIVTACLWAHEATASLLYPLLVLYPGPVLDPLRRTLAGLCSAPLSAFDTDIADQWIGAVLWILDCHPLSRSLENEAAMEILEMLTRLWKHAPELIELCWPCSRGSLFIFYHTGRLDVARAMIDAHSFSPIYSWSRILVVCNALLAWEAETPRDAVAAMKLVEGWGGALFHEVAPVPQVNDFVYLPHCWTRVQMLRWADRGRELREFLRQILPESFVAPTWVDVDANGRSLHYILLVVERIALTREEGMLAEALDDAQLVVTACESGTTGRRFRLCALIYGLISLGECNDEALKAFRRAVIIYNTDAPDFSDLFVQTKRKVEIGAATYLALAQHLPATRPDEVMVYAEGAVALCRELVVLVPRQRVMLVDCLRTVAQTTRQLGERETAIVAYREALDLLRTISANDNRVVPQLRYLLTELAALDDTPLDDALMICARGGAQPWDIPSSEDMFCPIWQLLSPKQRLKLNIGTTEFPEIEQLESLRLDLTSPVDSAGEHHALSFDTGTIQTLNPQEVPLSSAQTSPALDDNEHVEPSPKGSDGIEALELQVTTPAKDNTEFQHPPVIEPPTLILGSFQSPVLVVAASSPDILWWILTLVLAGMVSLLAMCLAMSMRWNASAWDTLILEVRK
ncbi:Tetratricopeptide repeat family [Mycena kentingensis (nom. inval.)]|nr:Tetratricopeptide repeat family [Mycena kentingensis (nom. inval.)]